MRKKIALFVSIPLLALASIILLAPVADPSYNDGSLYVLDVDNPSTYTVSCYEIFTSSMWTVKNETCTLTTAIINLPGDPEVDDPFDVPINLNLSKTGNLEPDDDVLVQYKIDDDDWANLAHIEGDDLSASPEEYGYIVSEAPAGSDITFRIIMKTNDNSEMITLNLSGGEDHVVMVGTPYFHGTYELFKPGGLPITLASFSGILEDKIVKLEWITSSETNNDHFELERTVDGRDFQMITIIQGAGNSNITHKYTAEDYTPVYGTNYYRIKQVDNDGKYTYSGLISVNIDEPENECKLSIRPNPCMGECQVYLEDCPQAAKNGFTIYVYDALGNVVSTKTAAVTDNSAVLTLDASSVYKPGVYIVRSPVDNNKILDEKVVITN